MTLYVDTSALLKRYVDEPGADRVNELLASDDQRVTARHTLIEIRRNLARLLDGSDLTDAREQFTRDVRAFAVIELDANTCELAASIAEQSGVRTLDALHLAAARRLGGSLTFLTFDVQQASAARHLGFRVVGA